ncbi:MICOS complex subunit mic25a-like isoform X6 [Oreochromis aureus]|uniref:MICOS complex subunit mic25a-like isoform X6 n=1 Tax=Oreochromis aureus TaxID=47969 RepID=UPI00195422C5|nr:MICOS complex subunit mic25a-like isoform X6 [Oreochromis aureus]
MGSGESTTRKVSFGVDDEDRVRILRGVKLSEDVLQRMRGVANIAPERTSSPASSPQTNTASSHSASSGSQSQQGPQQRAPPSSQHSKEDQRRYEHQQKILKEEWAKMAQREMEAAKEEMAKATSRERQQTRLEAERTKQLVLSCTPPSARDLCVACSPRVYNGFSPGSAATEERLTAESTGCLLQGATGTTGEEEFGKVSTKQRTVPPSCLQDGRKCQASQHRGSVCWPAGSDFILLQGQQRPDLKVF